MLSGCGTALHGDSKGGCVARALPALTADWHTALNPIISDDNTTFNTDPITTARIPLASQRCSKKGLRATCAALLNIQWYLAGCNACLHLSSLSGSSMKTQISSRLCRGLNGCIDGSLLASATLHLGTGRAGRLRAAFMVSTCGHGCMRAKEVADTTRLLTLA